jgi:hypothetical protein
MDSNLGAARSIGWRKAGWRNDDVNKNESETHRAKSSGRST